MKITQLTFTRFLAAIAVVIFHFNKQVFPFSINGIREITGFLNVLVSYFFVLSGFILTINAPEKVDLKLFYFNRFSRIYPVYFVALLCTLLLIVSIRPLSFSWDFHRIALSVFLVQSWNEKYALVLNYPAWSLSVEAFFYLIFPFLYSGLQQLSFQRRVYVTVAFWLLMQALFINLSFSKHSFVLYNPLFHLSTFLTGVLGGLFYREKRQRISTYYKIAVQIFFVMAVLLLFLILSGNQLFRMAYHNGLLAPFFILFIFIVAENKNNVFDWFAHRKTEYLGEISYGIYILQVPVFRLLTQTVNMKISFSTTTFFYIYLISLIIISVISYELIEKPSRLFLRNIYKNR